jgi:endonuclease YncB( thermonuclease family)
MCPLIIVLTLLLTSIAIIPISPTESLAHRDGCHRWHSCPSHDGSYACGDLGYNDECGGNEGNDEEVSDNADTRGRENDENGSRGDSNNGEQVSPSSSSTECQGQADCFTGIVTAIVDGDTIDVNNIRIRLSLVNTPERGDSGYSEAKGFTESTCPIGSKALVDEDDGQRGGSYGRLIGLVYCGNEGLPLNELLLNEGHAQIFGDFCGVSEFSEEDWVQKFGC